MFRVIHGLLSRESWFQISARSSEFFRIHVQLDLEIVTSFTVKDNIKKPAQTPAKQFNGVYAVLQTGPRGNFCPILPFRPFNPPFFFPSP